MESSDLAGMAARERRVSVGPEKMMAVFGAQLWLRRAERGERQRPRGSRLGVVRVWALMRTRAVSVWTNVMASVLLEYDEAARLMSSMVCQAVSPSSFLTGEERNPST